MNVMFRELVLTMAAIAALLTAAAQQPALKVEGKTNYRTEFAGYSTRELAAARDLAHEKYYRPITKWQSEKVDGGTIYSFDTDMSILWLDRDVFIHIEGGRNAHALFVNGDFVGSATDSRLPSEFRISDQLTDGTNKVQIAVVDGRLPEESIASSRADIEKIYLYSQPRLRIDDMIVRTAPDTTGKWGLLQIDVVVSSNYNYDESFAVGYDIYNPAGKLKFYDLRDITIAGRSRDTVRFETLIYDALQNSWSAEQPNLYSLTLYTKRGKINTEYIPLRVGFGLTEWVDGGLVRNGRKVDIKAARYNAASTEAQTQKDLAALKKQKINTIYVDYPQPVWFYELCDRTGFYLVDRANINTDPKGGDQSIGGTLSNNPVWVDDYTERVKGMFYRSRIHPCIVAWSTGGESGNGYAMYKAYEWLKGQGDERPVVYSTDRWNSDLSLPAPIK